MPGVKRGMALEMHLYTRRAAMEGGAPNQASGSCRGRASSRVIRELRASTRFAEGSKLETWAHLSTGTKSSLRAESAGFWRQGRSLVQVGETYGSLGRPSASELWRRRPLSAGGGGSVRSIRVLGRSLRRHKGAAAVDGVCTRESYIFRGALMRCWSLRAPLFTFLLILLLFLWRCFRYVRAARSLLIAVRMQSLVHGGAGH